jgi:hypothetical protein
MLKVTGATLIEFGGVDLIIKVSFKIDDTEEPALAEWINAFKKKGRIRSYHIRQALKAYLCGGGAPSPVFPVYPGNPGSQPEPVLVIETGNAFPGNQGEPELNEADLLAKLDSMF